MSSVEDIVGYVLNNQFDIITPDLQRYISLYNNGNTFNLEESFFDGQ